jgi:hypothetical protein
MPYTHDPNTYDAELALHRDNLHLSSSEVADLLYERMGVRRGSATIKARATKLRQRAGLAPQGHNANPDKWPQMSGVPFTPEVMEQPVLKAPRTVEKITREEQALRRLSEANEEIRVLRKAHADRADFLDAFASDAERQPDQRDGAIRVPRHSCISPMLMQASWCNVQQWAG